MDIVRIRPIAETVWTVFFVMMTEFLTTLETYGEVSVVSGKVSIRELRHGVF